MGKKQEGGKPLFDPSKIKSAYAVLGAALLVIDIPLVVWLNKSSSSGERITAGVLMVLVCLAIGGAALVVHRAPRVTAGLATIAAEGIGMVAPAAKEVAPSELDRPPPEVLTGPDRGYVINKPSPRWQVRELTMTEFIGSNLQVQNTQAVREQVAKNGEAREILVIELKDKATLVPIPGTTKIDGVIVPSALATELLIQLAIVPQDRLEAPLLFERTFEHNFFKAAGATCLAQVLGMQSHGSGKTATGRRSLYTQFRQQLEDVIVNGKRHSHIDLHKGIIGIEGIARDYHLIVTYFTSDELANVDIKVWLDEIKDLTDSFRPAESVDPSAQRARRLAEERAKAEAQLPAVYRVAFQTELGIVIDRISALDMNIPDDQRKVVDLLRPFKTFAEYIKLEEPELEPMWKALIEAEKGDSRPLIEFLSQKDEPESLPARESTS